MFADMKRIYEALLREHFSHERQMAFVAGPRQVGKSTLIDSLCGTNDLLFNWDRPEDRRAVLKGSDFIIEQYGFTDLGASQSRRLVAFDEIHKFRQWKNFLKGFFDACEDSASVLVTGSARLNVYKRGGDSLMGRYFLYRMHPLSVGELVPRPYDPCLIRAPGTVTDDEFDALYRFGGFPEPYLRGTDRFYNRWIGLRSEQMFREDLRDLTRVQEIDQLMTLSQILLSQAGAMMNYSALANEVRVSVDTIRRWMTLLESIYFSFRIRPWFRNVSKSLRKQPKVYPWDWSPIKNEGARIESFAASHLFKAVHWWTDLGLGQFELHYIRDTAQREVDFLISKNSKPWMMVEVKKSPKEPLSPALKHFAHVLKVQHAFQAVMELDAVDADCFDASRQGMPFRVPLRTLLSQLV
jgi:predicted AAA+ superfamily ATPase